jgi:hypothetical protein
VDKNHGRVFWVPVFKNMHLDRAGFNEPAFRWLGEIFCH